MSNMNSKCKEFTVLGAYYIKNCFCVILFYLCKHHVLPITFAVNHFNVNIIENFINSCLNIFAMFLLHQKYCFFSYQFVGVWVVGMFLCCPRSHVLFLKTSQWIVISKSEFFFEWTRILLVLHMSYDLIFHGR